MEINKLPGERFECVLSLAARTHMEGVSTVLQTTAFARNFMSLYIGDALSYSLPSVSIDNGMGETLDVLPLNSLWDNFGEYGTREIYYRDIHPRVHQALHIGNYNTFWSLGRYKTR